MINGSNYLACDMYADRTRLRCVCWNALWSYSWRSPVSKYAVVQYVKKGLKEKRTVVSKHSDWEDAKENRPQDKFKGGKATLYKVELIND